MGVEKKLDISLYANYLFSHFQMQEIRLGLEAGLDVSSYCGLLYSAKDMKEKRQELLNRKTAKTTTVAGIDPVFDDFRKNEFVISVEDNGNYLPRFG